MSLSTDAVASSRINTLGFLSSARAKHSSYIPVCVYIYVYNSIPVCIYICIIAYRCMYIYMYIYIINILLNIIYITGADVVEGKRRNGKGI